MIIGLAGYAQSGKDTVAQILVDNYGFRRIAFADKVREFVYELDFPMDPSFAETVGLQNIVEVSGWDEAKQHKDVRALLQNLGVGARKVFGENFWVKQALREFSPEEKIVITDVRFPNEAEMVKRLNGQMWRVIRPGVTAVNSHISENALDDYEFDFDIYNDSTVTALNMDIEILMEDLSV